MDLVRLKTSIKIGYREIPFKGLVLSRKVCGRGWE